MIRALCLAVAVVLVGFASSARADAEQCEEAAGLLKGVYATLEPPPGSLENAKVASDACLSRLAAQVNDCRSRFPDREQECREHIARQDACTKLLDAYALAIKKRSKSMDLGSAINDDPVKDYDRAKGFEGVCFGNDAPRA